MYSYISWYYEVGDCIIEMRSAALSNIIAMIAVIIIREKKWSNDSRSYIVLTSGKAQSGQFWNNIIKIINNSWY